jgi:hypothetical protein
VSLPVLCTFEERHAPFNAWNGPPLDTSARILDADRDPYARNHPHRQINLSHTRPQASPNSHLLHFLAKIIQDGKIAHFNPFRANENAALRLTLEIARASYRAIVFPGGFVKGDADPGPQTGDLRNRSDVGDDTAAVVSGGEEVAAEADGNSCWVLVYCLGE